MCYVCLVFFAFILVLLSLEADTRSALVVTPIWFLLLAVLGTVFGLGGVLRFRRQGTTVTPLHPEQASALVTGGLYRLSRNPMYLGLLCWTMALACYLGGLAVWLGPLLLWGWLSRFQIVPEEQALQRRFGEAYANYCRRVRRWC